MSYFCSLFRAHCSENDIVIFNIGNPRKHIQSYIHFPISHLFWHFLLKIYGTVT